MGRLLRAFLTACLLASGGFPLAPAAAAPATPAARLDPAALAAADRLLTAMGYDRLMQRTADAMLQTMGPMLKQSLEQRGGKPVDDELIRRIAVIQGDFLRSTLVNSPDMRRAVATIYASMFSAGELDHLAALYKDPVMRKWSEVAPGFSAQILPLVQSITEAHRSELEERIKTAVIDYYKEKGATPGT